MLERMKALIRRNSICVLATCSDDKPHCSLMAYVTDEEAATVYIASLRSSKKYLNLQQNPRVSLLMDSRTDHGEAGSIEALTVSGVSTVIRDQAEREQLLIRIQQSLPQLQAIVQHPEVEVIAIQIESLQLLAGPEKAHFVKI